MLQFRPGHLSRSCWQSHRAFRLKAGWVRSLLSLWAWRPKFLTTTCFPARVSTACGHLTQRSCNSDAQVRTVLCTHEPGQSCFLRTLRSKVPHSRSGTVSSLQESEPGFWPSNLEAQYGAPKATHCGPSVMWGQFGVGGMLTIPLPTAIPPGNYPSPGKLPKPCKNIY